MRLLTKEECVDLIEKRARYSHNIQYKESLIELTKDILPLNPERKEKDDMCERRYIIKNSLTEIPKCAKEDCDNKVHFKSINEGYHKYCSLKCSSKDVAYSNIEIKKKKYGENYNSINGKHTWENTSEEQRQKIKEKRKCTTIERFGVETYMQCPDFQEKARITNLEKYGVEDAIQNPEIWKKGQQTCLERYGIKSVVNSKESKKLQKIKNLEKYGVEIPSQSPEIWRKGQTTKFNRYGYITPFSLPEIQEKRRDTFIKNHDLGLHNYSAYTSKIATEFCNSVYCNLPMELQNHSHYDSLNSEYRIGYRNDQGRQCHYFYDFCITSLKIIIEFQGDYWHRNPCMFESTEENENIWGKDKHKKFIAERGGFEVLYIWENDYRKNKQEILKNLDQYITNKYELQKEVS